MPSYQKSPPPTAEPTSHATTSSAASLNAYTVVVCMVASSGALLFGLDVGITGGVLAMPSFLEQFFPQVYDATAALLPGDGSNANAYCSYDNQVLSLFTSSFFLAGIVSSVVASFTTRLYGRKSSMVAGALLYVAGSTLQASAINTAMLVCGRVVMGLGVGFVNQCVPLFLAEIPPPEIRGSLQIMFQLFVNVGILLAGLINVGTSELEQGWRISLGIFIVPALVLLAGGIWLPETPQSLAERGRSREARLVLEKLRSGCGQRNNDDCISEEFEQLERDALLNKGQDQSFQSQWRTFLSKPYRGEATVACAVAFFSQFTGINSMLYYAPQLFGTLGGSSTNGALVNATVVASVLLAGAITSIVLVDRVGRRPLLIAGGTLMAVFQIATAVVLRSEFDPFNSGGSLETSVVSPVLLALVCLFTYSFGTSWGPLGWMVPVESQSLRTRSAGSTASVGVNFFAVFLTTQFFLPMLCTMEWGAFLFFAGFDVAMTAFSWAFVPETKGVPIERIRTVWKEHWFWGGMIPDTEKEGGDVAGGTDEKV